MYPVIPSNTVLIGLIAVIASPINACFFKSVEKLPDDKLSHISNHNLKCGVGK
jgi:hypothetical protein